MRPALGRIAVMLVCLQSVGCLGTLTSDPMGRKYSLENIQRRYTELIRWGEFQRAANYVEAEALEEFSIFESSFANIRITDYEVGRIELDSEKKSATVQVTYHGYRDGLFIEKPLRETQRWIRKNGNHWQVRPELAQLIAPLNRRRDAVPAAPAR